MIDGALGFGVFGFSRELGNLLSSQFSVYEYDRRGRGDSGNTQPYALEREIEDIDAIINESGGSAYLYGISSGACLALEAAIRLGHKVQKLAMYEAPYDSSEGARKAWRDYTRQLNELIVANRRGDAVELFMAFVGTPSEMIAGMRQSPSWPTLKSVAPTLVYDAAAMGEDRLPPIGRTGRVMVQALVMNGGAGMPFMKDTAISLAKAMPNAKHRVLEGERHDVSSEALAPVLIGFFNE